MEALIITAGDGYHSTGSYNVERLKTALISKGVNTRFYGNAKQSSLDDVLNVPDIAYIAYMLPAEKLAETQRFRDKGVFFINSPESVALCSDKMEIYNRLALANIPQPKTFILDDTNINNFSSFELTWPCVIKPATQSVTNESPCAGLDVLLCNDQNELETNFALLKQRYDNIKIMIQEYIESGSGDMLISSWVFGDAVSSSITIGDPSQGGSSPLDEFKSHRKVGHQRIAIETPPNLLQLIGQISTALGADIFRVEVFYSGDNYKVCKIKVPGDRLAHDAGAGIDSSEIIADYIIRRYNSR